MNHRLYIKNNKIKSINNKDIEIKDNTITLKKDGNYLLKYIDSNNISIDINIPDNKNINLSIFSKDNNIAVNNHYILNKNSTLTLFQFYDHNDVLENSTIDLNGEYAKINQNFSSIIYGKMEYHIIVNHNKRNVISNIYNKSIGIDKSSITMKIDSNLEKGNIDCIMEQDSRILTLGDVSAKIIPNMFIEENSVEARHGSIISSFNEEELFYLMSRGISKEEAMNLLVKGFLFSNMQIDLEKREYVMNSILNMRR